jgi:acyl-CoA thioester hydrolase
MPNENSVSMKILESSIEQQVRFSETDAMGVVWHGNYLKFFEDGREKFGAEFGMEYLDVFKQGYFTPIVKSEINHKSSVFYGDKVHVSVMLELHYAAKIVFHYEVINMTTNQIAATGKTMQVFMNANDRSLELVKPAFYEEWENKQNWKEV